MTRSTNQHSTDHPTDQDPRTEGSDEAPTPIPLLELRDPLPPVVEDPGTLERVAEAIDRGSGPVAIDAERASGHRYSSRAYLIQLRREGAGTALVDPIPLDSLEPLAEALSGTEWILHAATQDLPCLGEVGLHPAELFDTELAGRLLGYPRVGLATLVETLLGRRLRKEHSAVDWSTRPLPSSWLEYAALDVEVLTELREVLLGELEETGKIEWARQEFEHLRHHRAPVRAEPWRRTSGTHRLRGRRPLAVVRQLWLARDEVARERDVAPGRIVPDSALVAAAQAMPTDRRSLLGTEGFHGRGARRYADRWVAAIREATRLPEEDLPNRSQHSDGPPPARAWSDRDPVAARRLAVAKEEMAALSEEHGTPTENLLTPDSMRRVLWQPPGTRDAEGLARELAEQLRSLAAREWQVELTVPALTRAVLAGDE